MNSSQLYKAVLLGKVVSHMKSCLEFVKHHFGNSEDVEKHSLD